MTLYLCLDQRNGMLFNNRRQSRDAAVLEDIRANLPDKLTIGFFSETLVREAGLPYALAEESLPGDAHFFMEAPFGECLLSQAAVVVIYRWNRRYPADVWFDCDLSDFRLESVREFPGRSHETITKEVYVR